MDAKICTLAAIIVIGLIECSLIFTGNQDGTTLVLVVAAVAGLGGYVLPSPLKSGESKDAAGSAQGS